MKSTGTLRVKDGEVEGVLFVCLLDICLFSFVTFLAVGHSHFQFETSPTGRGSVTTLSPTGRGSVTISLCGPGTAVLSDLNVGRFAQETTSSHLYFRIGIGSSPNLFRVSWLFRK